MGPPGERLDPQRLDSGFRAGARPRNEPAPDISYRPVAHAAKAPAHRPLVIGFGPCGIFAALILADTGLAPIVLERGKPVRERTQDTWGLWRQRRLHEDSNVQFGEGGAGTFSDGKLHSGIHDPQGRTRKVLQVFAEAGAPELIRLLHLHDLKEEESIYPAAERYRPDPNHPPLEQLFATRDMPAGWRCRFATK